MWMCELGAGPYGLFTPFNPFESTQTAKLVACVNTLIIQLPQTEIESVRPATQTGTKKATPSHPPPPIATPTHPPTATPPQFQLAVSFVTSLVFGSHKQHTAEEIKSENKSNRNAEKVIQERSQSHGTMGFRGKRGQTAQQIGGYDTCGSDFREDRAK